MKFNYNISSGKDIYSNINVIDLLNSSFGIKRLLRPVYKLRPNQPIPSLSFVINNITQESNLNPISVVFFWPVILPSNQISLLLGPIAVGSNYQNRGFGSKIILYALDEIKKQYKYSSVCVSGIKEYYTRFGFVSLPKTWSIAGGSTYPLQLMIHYFDKSYCKNDANNYSGEIKAIFKL